jgi:protein SOK2
MGSQDSYQQWPQQNMNGGQAANPMSIDTGLSNTARSMPATPATTPPGTSLQSMQSYPPASQPYDNSRQLYNAPSSQQQSQYPPSNTNSQDRGMYTQQTNYVKNDMGPPSTRPVGGAQSDNKASNGEGMIHPSHTEHVSQPQGEEEAEHEHDGEYTHDSNGYDASRNSYYSNTAPIASISHIQHMSSEITGSPDQGTSGRATPRTAQAPQPYYSQQQGYSTPPRTQQQPSRTVEYLNDNRGQTNGAQGNDVYAPHTVDTSNQQHGYPPSQPVMNGQSNGVKRGRDDDDERPESVGSMDIKRRKTMMEPSAQTYDSSMNRPQAAIPSQRRR